LLDVGFWSFGTNHLFLISSELALRDLTVNLVATSSVGVNMGRFISEHRLPGRKVIDTLFLIKIQN
jgi:ABC-type sulfate transport system permease component